MARSSLYAPRRDDEHLPMAQPVPFPLNQRRPVESAVPDWQPSAVAPVEVEAAVEAPAPRAQTMQEYAAQLRDEINRLAAEGHVRLELDGSGEHARLEVLVPVQRVTWERPA